MSVIVWQRGTASEMKRRSAPRSSSVVEKFRQILLHGLAFKCDSWSLEGHEFMHDYVECPELTGKTIQTLRIYRDTGDGTIQIELTDGTSFSCCLSNQPTIKASLYKGGVGTPETLREYDV